MAAHFALAAGRWARFSRCPCSGRFTRTSPLSVPLTRAGMRAPGRLKQRKQFPTLEVSPPRERSRMKYCRFLFEGHMHYGAVGNRAANVDCGSDRRAGRRPGLQSDARARQSWCSRRGFDFEPMPLSAAALLPPVTPSKIICVGRNYRDHVKELGNEVPAEPLLFFKPPSSLLAPAAQCALPGAVRASRLRRRAGAGDRPAHAATSSPKRTGARCARLHAGQRHLRSRFAEEGWAMDPGQGLRYVLPGRPGGERRA